MEKKPEQKTQKLVSEHLSLSVSMMVLTLLMLSHYLPGFWRIAVAVLMGGAIAWNHFLCIRLHKTLKSRNSV